MIRLAIGRFQSSPDPKAGCYDSIGIGDAEGHCFNPHPTRRPGATVAAKPGARPRASFNPHPTRRPGATEFFRALTETDLVSILTRPEGRVLPIALSCAGVLKTVSILTRPEGRVLLGKR